MLPGYKNVDYKPVSEIDFTSAKSLKSNLDKQAAGKDISKPILNKKYVTLMKKWIKNFLNSVNVEQCFNYKELLDATMLN